MTNICLPKQSRDTDSHDKNTQFVILSGRHATKTCIFDMTVLSVVSRLKSTAYDGQTRGIKHFVATVSKLYRKVFEFCAASHCDAKRYLYRDYHGAMTNYQANISTRYYTGCLSPNFAPTHVSLGQARTLRCRWAEAPTATVPTLPHGRTGVCPSVPPRAMAFLGIVPETAKPQEHTTP